MLIGCCHCDRILHPPSESDPPSESNSISTSDSASFSQSGSSQSQSEGSNIETTIPGCAFNVCIDEVVPVRWLVDNGGYGSVSRYCSQEIDNVAIAFTNDFTNPSSPRNTLCGWTDITLFPQDKNSACINVLAYQRVVLTFTKFSNVTAAWAISLVYTVYTHNSQPTNLYYGSSGVTPMNCLAPIALSYQGSSNPSGSTYWEFHFAMNGAFVMLTDPHPYPPTVTLVPA